MPTLEVGSVHDITILHFTHYSKVRILAFQRRSPFVPESVGHILPGVHADPVHAGHTNPPKRILNEIACDLGIVLVQIGKKVKEPCRRWRIRNPTVIGTGVIDDLILNNLYTRAMCSLDEFAELRERPEVLLNLVKVLRVVAMKSGARFPFLQFDLIWMIVVVVPWGEPDSGDAEIFQIRQMIDNALYITA